MYQLKTERRRNMIIELSLLFLSIISVFLIWAKWKLTYWQRRGIKTLPTNILFGNFKDNIYQRISPGWLIGRLHLEADEKLPFIGIYIFHQPSLLIRDPLLMKKIFVKDFDTFPNHKFAVKNPDDPIGTRNIFSIDNPEWKHLRTKLSPAFSSGKIKQLFDLMVESSETLNDFLYNKFNNNTNNDKITIDLKLASQKYTTDVISSLAFGVRTNSFDDSTAEFWRRSIYPTTMTLKQIIRLFCIFFFPKLNNLLVPGTLLDHHTDYFRDVFWRSMDTREKSNIERGDVMDTLLKLKNDKQDSTFTFTRDELVAQSVVFLLAGQETSSTTIAFGLYELAKQPELQDRVRNEIREKIKNKGFTYEAVQDMKYLMQVINETLRMYPPAPLLDRVAEKNYTIPDTDIVIEKGTAVYVALPGIQMDPKYFPNPDVFDPDRFSDERKHEIQPCTFMPFGEGPRICIGMRVGMLQTAVGFIQILKNYEVSINPAYKTEIHPGNIFLGFKNGAHLYVKKYQT